MDNSEIKTVGRFAYQYRGDNFVAVAYDHVFSGFAAQIAVREQLKSLTPSGFYCDLVLNNGKRLIATLFDSIPEKELVEMLSKEKAV